MPGYYLWNPNTEEQEQVEFIDNYWYFVYRDEETYISKDDRIVRNAKGTGFWKYSDPEHPNYIPTELPPIAGPSTLTLPRQRADTLESVEPSLFAAAPNPEYDPEDYYSPVADTTLEVLTAQFEHVLSLEDREPENPLTPEVPAYTYLIEEAVQSGLNIPPPPPLLTPEVSQHIPVAQVPPLPFPVAPPALFQALLPAVPPVQPMAGQQQAAPQIQQQQAPPAVQMTDKFRGNPPDVFNGNRNKSQTFIRQFHLFKGLNENHEVMIVPYFRAMYILSLMKGPYVDDWIYDQVTALREKTTRVQNPIDRNDEALWNDFNTAFTNTFTNTAKEQTAHQKLTALKMYKNDIDNYIATFENLVRDTGYNCTARGTIHLFVQGLNPQILKDILYSNTIPDTMNGWQTAAQEEIKKQVFRETILPSKQPHYKWKFECNYTNSFRPRQHPNDKTVPMDVDQPVFTQINCTHTKVNKAYTDEDKRKHHAEGQCFNCSRIGHMAKECPMRKTSASQFKLTPRPSSQQNWRTTM